MKLISILVALSMLLGFTAARDPDRGRMGNGSYFDLGISLSAGYGTISAHLLPRSSGGGTLLNTKWTNSRYPRTPFSTNRYIDIAKVEGGEVYKDYMLGLQDETQLANGPKSCSFGKSVCQYWPMQTHQTINPVAPMLKALITAAEFTLETKIKSVAVTLYDTKIADYNTTKLHVASALDGMGVVSHNFLGHSAVEAAKSLGSWGFPNVVLSVDLSRDALSTSLWTEGLQQREWTHSTNLSYASLERSHSLNETFRFERNFKAALDFVCANSRSRTREDPGAVLSEQTGLGALVDYEKVGGKAVYDNVDAVILLGEHAGDQEMQKWLREVVTGQFANGDVVDFSLSRDVSPDSAFVGSRGAAWGELSVEQVVWRQRCAEVCEWRKKWGLGCDSSCTYWGSWFWW